MSSVNTTGCTCPPNNSAVAVPHQPTCPMYSPPPQMNAKDEGQKRSMWRLSDDRKHVESAWQGIWAPLLPSEVVKALKEYEHDRNRFSALQQQVTELEGLAALADELRDQLRWLELSAQKGSPLANLLARYDALSAPASDTGGHEYRPSSDLVGSPCALCRQRPDEHDGLGSEESWNND